MITNIQLNWLQAHCELTYYRLKMIKRNHAIIIGTVNARVKITLRSVLC